MLIFEKIRWKNFLSTGREFTEFDFTANKSTLFVGVNGAGKSTLLDALSFALYNKSYRDLTHPKLINSINKKDCLVELEFSLNNVAYKIRRGLKPKVFELYRYGTLVNQEDVRDYQSFIEEEVLKTSHKSFSQIVVLGSANYIPFMKLKTQQRREFIEDTLDLSVFSTMNELLKEKVKVNKENLLDNDTQIVIVKNKIEVNNKYLESVKNSNDEIIAEKKKIILDYEKKEEVYINEYSKNETLIGSLQSELEKIYEKMDTLNKIEGFAEKATANITKIEKDIKFFEHTKICPTCSQGIEESLRTKTLEENFEKLKKQKDVIDECSKKLEAEPITRNRMFQIQNSINELNSKQSEIILTRKQILKHSNQLQEEINLLKSKNQSLQVTDESIQLSETLNKLLKIRESFLEEKEILSVATVLLKDGGIKSHIIRRYIPEINKIVNKYLEALDFFVGFELDENFNEKIRSRYRDEFSYENFSEGEKARIDLALLFTWRQIARLRNSISTNLLILDEVFDKSMDNIGSEELIKLLDSVTMNSNVIIISHKDTVIDKFENVIRFKKVKNFSIMEK